MALGFFLLLFYYFFFFQGGGYYFNGVGIMSRGGCGFRVF